VILNSAKEAQWGMEKNMEFCALAVSHGSRVTISQHLLSFLFSAFVAAVHNRDFHVLHKSHASFFVVNGLCILSHYIFRWLRLSFKVCCMVMI